MRIRVSVQTNHFFGNTNTQKTVAKEKSLRTEEKPSFVYLCIGVSGTALGRLCLRPPDPNRWKAEVLSFLHVLLVWGVNLA